MHVHEIFDAHKLNNIAFRPIILEIYLAYKYAFLFNLFYPFFVS